MLYAFYALQLHFSSFFFGSMCLLVVLSLYFTSHALLSLLMLVPFTHPLAFSTQN